MNWGQNVFSTLGFGGVSNPDQNKLNQLLNTCMQTGSYTFGGNAQEAATKILTSLKQKSPSISVEQGDYAETPSKTYQVVYFSGPIDVHYSGSKYNIYIKVLLPPNFPEASPIVSVINIDPAVFTVNKEYAPNLLPDETFGVKLFNASQWTFHKNFETLVFELTSKLGSAFPFFRSQGNAKPQPPRYYPQTSLSAGIPQQSGWGQPTNPFAQQQQSSLPPGFPAYNPPPQQQNPSQMGSYMPPASQQSNSGVSPSAHRFITDQIGVLTLAVKSDLADEKKQFVKIASIRNENRLLAEQSQRYYVV